MSHVDEAQLSRFFDGELESEEASLVQRHLDSCDACQTLAKKERRVRERAAAILADASPQGVTMPPFAELQARATRPQSGRKIAQHASWKPLAWAATVVLAVALGWYVRGQPAVSDGARTASEVDSTPALALAEQDENMTQRQDRARRLEQMDRPTASAPTEAGNQLPPPAPSVGNRATPVDDESPVAGRIAGAQPREQIAEDRFAQAMAQEAAQPKGLIDQVSVATPLADTDLVISGVRNGWRETDRAGAQAFLGAPVATIDDLDIVTFEVRETAGDRLVRVTQRLSSGVLVQLLQQTNTEAEETPRPAERRADRATLAARDGITALTEVRGDYLITLQAPMPADSLRALFNRVRE